MNRMKRVLMSALSVVVVSMPLSATEAPALADTYTATGFPSNNFGALGNINVGGGNTGLMRFAITEVLPASTVGRNVQKATLRLWVNKVNTAGSIGIFRAGTAWNELTVTQGTIPTTGAPVASSVAVGATGGIVLVDVTSVVRDWVDTPGQNQGLLLTASTGAPGTSVILDSRENTLTGRMPSIDITLGSADGSAVVRDANGNYLGTTDMVRMDFDYASEIPLNRGGYIYYISRNGVVQVTGFSFSGAGCSGTAYAQAIQPRYAKRLDVSGRTGQWYKFGAGDGYIQPTSVPTVQSHDEFDGVAWTCVNDAFPIGSAIPMIPVNPVDLGIVVTGNPPSVAPPLRFE